METLTFTAPHPGLPEQAAGWLVAIAAMAVAVIGARDDAGSWNDGSRLATVECLVDYHTLAIDRSIFVRSPADASAPCPYPSDDPLLCDHGTRDKLQVDGRYYSDKSPVPALGLAAVYQVLQAATGLTAREQPGWFCYWLTLASSGLAYVAAVWCTFRLGGVLSLPLKWRFGLTGSLALATVALAYTRHVNNHILLLGVMAALILVLARLGLSASERGGLQPNLGSPRRLLLAAGTLTGLGYTVDLGIGPVLLVATSLLVALRCRRARSLATFVVAALPWLVLHHTVNYLVGGTLKPANAVPEYLAWPGSPFDASNMTGGWNHESVGDFLLYAAAMLFGKRGFFVHNLPLLLLLPGLFALKRTQPREWPEIGFAVGLGAGCWLMYAVASNNYSGACCSIRWFVPLLAPGYLILAVLLRDCPKSRRSFLVLTGFGMALGAIMWWKGPWIMRSVPLRWPLNFAALAVWGWLAQLSGRVEGQRRPFGPSPHRREVSAADGPSHVIR